MRHRGADRTHRHPRHAGSEPHRLSGRGSKKWHPDNDTNSALYQKGEGIRTRLTRVVTHEGPVCITRILDWEVPMGKRLFIDAERSRHLMLRVNGRAVSACCECSASTPYTFEVTGLMSGHDEIGFIADNSSPGWPHDAIIFSSAATDETQTNWNGLLGYVGLRVEAVNFIQTVRAYPHANALDGPTTQMKKLHAGINEVCLRDLPLKATVRRWDEEESNLYDLTASLGDAEYTVRFGVRDFKAEGGFLTLNGRRVFLRSEANWAVFPETGHPPMTVEEWRGVLSTYHSYGVNCMRFHSHTPSEPAFTAADEMGMLMQPELGHQRMEELLNIAHSLDTTRLYACASNAHYGWYGHQGESDFYASANLCQHQMRATYAEMLAISTTITPMRSTTAKPP